MPSGTGSEAVRAGNYAEKNLNGREQCITHGY